MQQIIFNRAGAVAAIGDINVDGVGDVMVGTPDDDDGGKWNGAVYVIFLQADGAIGRQQKISALVGGLISPLSNSGFGSSVAGIGDVNGDGVGDAMVGSSGDDGFRGSVYILLLNSDGTIKGDQGPIPNRAGGFPGPKEYDHFGSSIAMIGDVDGDGVGDVLVSAPLDGSGRVYLLLLHQNGTVKGGGKLRASTFGIPTSGIRKTYTMAWIGDINGDGIIDAIFGNFVANDFRGEADIVLLSNSLLEMMVPWKPTHAPTPQPMSVSTPAPTLQPTLPTSETTLAPSEESLDSADSSGRATIVFACVLLSSIVILGNGLLGVL